jgi:hypothetical protein
MRLAARIDSPAGCRCYERRRDLPRLLPLWPHEVHPPDLAAHASLLARMRRALRLERQRGLAGHWTYDLARHALLLQAYRAETAEYVRKARAASQRPAALAK